MQKYYNEVIIEANIENVFEFLNGDEKNLKVIDPHILSSKLISETKEVIGSKYLQTYMQKGKTINYEITVTSYLNNKNVKGYGINFKPLKMFDLTATYRLEKLNDKETLIKYEILKLREDGATVIF